MKNNFFKVLLFILLAVYVISPADLCPGPIDDLLAIAFYFLANRSNFSLENKKSNVEVIDADGNEI
ncbi:hypothetical protein [Butyrivibrio sp. MC2021]|uniref:hypothetical protein n=1 Tax=Butyrivibrio sp. MC2021 TaxID=1408306 RepID=UPI00047D10BD|nr:hypothetical protein [Butyrivibrio sp. MC2021]